jgi:hypothetical protein
MERPRHLAQANVARQRAPLSSPLMGEFALALDPVYRIAEGSPGFVWRLVRRFGPDGRPEGRRGRRA